MSEDANQDLIKNEGLVKAEQKKRNSHRLKKIGAVALASLAAVLGIVKAGDSLNKAMGPSYDDAVKEYPHLTDHSGLHSPDVVVTVGEWQIHHPEASRVIIEPADVVASHTSEGIPDEVADIKIDVVQPNGRTVVAEGIGQAEYAQTGINKVDKMLNHSVDKLGRGGEDSVMAYEAVNQAVDDALQNGYPLATKLAQK